MLALRVVVGGRRRQVLAVPGAHADLAGPIAAVPPDLVALAEEVAGRQVVDRDAARLVDDDPVASHSLTTRALGPVGLLLGVRAARLSRAGLGPVDDDPVAVHPADVKVVLLNEEAGARLVRGSVVALAVVGALVIVAGAHEDPVPLVRRVDRALDRAVLAPD